MVTIVPSTEYRVPSSVLDGTVTECRITVNSLTDTGTIPTDRQTYRNALVATSAANLATRYPDLATYGGVLDTKWASWMLATNLATFSHSV